jgi:glycosyltransferase involved in cell wall biosynthesis
MAALHINARFLTQPASGTQRYAEEVLNALDTQAADWPERPQIIAWVPPGERREPRWQHIALNVTGQGGGHLWEQTSLALASRNGWLLNLVSSGPLVHPRQIMTMHDAAIFSHPENFSRAYGTFHRTLRPRLAARARQICTVSEFSRQALAREMGVDTAKFTVVPNGSDHLLRLESAVDVMNRRNLVAGRYVLFVGNRAPHKNFKAALDAFLGLGRTDLHLVTVGIGRSKIFGTDTFDDGPGIRHLADVDDAELRSLYENAALLLFPSRYEGFGIPPLEAMSLGCPVVASSAAAIPEVVGGAALIVDPDHVRSMTRAMETILGDDVLRASLVEKGRRRAAMFTWAEAGRKLRNMLEATMGIEPVLKVAA